MLFVLTLIMSFSLQAQHLDAVCKNAYISLGGGHYQNNPPIFHHNYLARRTLVGERSFGYVVESLQGQKIYQTPERIYDLVLIDDHLVLLFGFHLSVITLQGQEVIRFPLNPLPFAAAHGRSMVKVDQMLYIARGAAGVSAFSIDEMRMIWDADLREISTGGSAEAIVFDDEKLQIVAATTQENGFTGVISMDLSGKILATSPYDKRRAGVLGPGARARWHNKSLLINNLGWIHIVTQAQLEQNRALRPRWLAHQIRENNSRYHYMMLTGDMMVDGHNLLGCGLTYEGVSRERVAKLFKIFL